MGKYSTPEKNPVQRKSSQEESALGKAAQPPAFQLTAEKDQAKPAQLQDAPAAQETPAEIPAELTPVLEAQIEVPEMEMTEADRLREGVAKSAVDWTGKEFYSKEKIEATRISSGLKNFTTCLEFAGKMMGESDRLVYDKDWKMATATIQAFSRTKIDWEQAVSANLTSAGWEKSVALFDTALTRVTKQKNTLLEEIAGLRKPQAEGEKDLVFKQRHLRADALEKHGVRALDSVLRILNAQRDKYQGKADRFKEKAKEIDANNAAMIKATDGMKGGRPKQGEFIILAQAPGGSKYGVNAKSEVFLAGGTFKHIAIFMEVLKEDDGTGCELWRTVDGGGTEGKETLLRIRLSDRMVFHGQEGAALPEVGSASGTQLAGWMDMDKIVEKRDQKLAEGKK